MKFSHLSADLTASLQAADDDTLKGIIGTTMTLLRQRKAAFKAAFKPVAAVTEVTDKAAKRAADKAEYLAHKAAYASRPIGIQCVSTGKLLKRRFNDMETAQAQAAELTASMKREYRAIVLVA